MEELIAQYPDDFFPGKKLILIGRQESFKGAGRFDLLFQDGFGTKILMELKARTARYEDATQLARYKDAFEERGERAVLMWLVATDIPRSVREFMDRIGIQYSEIHEVEFREVSEHRGVVFPRTDRPERSEQLADGNAEDCESRVDKMQNGDKDQLHEKAEKLAKTEFAKHGFQLTQSRPNEKHVDMIVQKPSGKRYKVRLQSRTWPNYPYFPKETFEPANDLFAVLVLFEGSREALYLIPSLAWNTPDDLFVSRDYEKKKSKPEWGLNLSEKNRKQLDEYQFDRQINKL